VQAGTIIATKYQLIAPVGQGGMAAVWRAEHLTLKAPVAIKLIDPSIAQLPVALARFHKEARAAATLRSPHVVQVLDHGVDEQTNTPYIAMELLEGESLADRLSVRGKLSAKETVQLFVHIGRAMGRAHDMGIIHRDLKPDNIFLVENDDEEIAKVFDFGIAQAEGLDVPGIATGTGEVVGTAYYMSPEQIRGTPVDARADLWSLAVIAHECLTGELPFTAETLGDLAVRICVDPIVPPSSRGDVPDGFDAWFFRATARPPEERFGSVRELVSELRAACGEPEVDARADHDEADRNLGSRRVGLGTRDAGDPRSSDPPSVASPQEFPGQPRHVRGIRWFLGASVLACGAAVYGYASSRQEATASGRGGDAATNALEPTTVAREPSAPAASAAPPPVPGIHVVLGSKPDSGVATGSGSNPAPEATATKPGSPATGTDSVDRSGNLAPPREAARAGASRVAPKQLTLEKMLKRRKY
jgi:serine/threonine protein kinase